MSNEKKFIKVQCSVGQPIICIFSGSGTQIAFKWTRHPIVHMGWTNDEELVCIQEDGMVVVHVMFGKYQHAFSISQKVQDAKVVHAKMFTNPQNLTGIAVLTSNFKIFLIDNIKEPKTRQLSQLPRSNIQPTSWVVQEDTNEILIARGEQLYHLKQDEHHISAMLEPDIIKQVHFNIGDVCLPEC
nr:unnamed protein product [Callosobruchus analis]